MAFGSIDWRQLDRTAQGIAQFGQNQLRNDVTRVQVEQDHADRANAEATYGRFKQKIQDALPKEGKAPNYDVLFSAAAEAGEGFARTGGRHSQASALSIHQMLDDLVKIHPPQARTVKPEYRDVVGPDGLPEIKTVNGIKVKHQEIIHPESGAVMGQNWLKMDAEHPKAPAGGRGTDQEKKNVEKYRVDYLKENQSVSNMETYYGKDRLSQWREELKADPEAQAIMGKSGMDFDKALEEMIAQNASKAEKATKIKALNAYEKSLANKQAHHKALNGLGYRVDDETGELITVNPKEAKKPEKKAATEESSVTHDYVPGKGLVPRGAK